MKLLTLFLAASLANVFVNPDTEKGPVKMMNAANNGPVSSNFEAYKALQIPYARTHDTALGESYERYVVDISLVFPDWNAPVGSPASYDFAGTDKVLADMAEAGTRPFYRLGQSIEHQITKHGIFPPKSNRKWARICEHIIRHYNEGWADGFHYGIEYWEIWNEPDLDWGDGRWKTDPRTWAGTPEQFNKLYETASKHLKKCFPDLKIGGPAFANPHKYGPDFLDYVRSSGSPLDFFSWHVYHRKPWRVAEYASDVRKILDDRGFVNAESVLDEWNYVRSWSEPDHYSASQRVWIKGAAFVAATMCECQKAPLDLMMYYDLRPATTWNGAFKAFVYELQPPYYALLYWARLREFGTCIESGCDTGNIYTCASRSDDGRLRLLVVRYHEDDSADSVRLLTVDAPEGYRLSSVRLTDASGSDVEQPIPEAARSVEVPMGPNAILLAEFRHE